jgi:hypothetical protein
MVQVTPGNRDRRRGWTSVCGLVIKTTTSDCGRQTADRRFSWRKGRQRKTILNTERSADMRLRRHPMGLRMGVDARNYLECRHCNYQIGGSGNEAKQEMTDHYERYHYGMSPYAYHCYDTVIVMSFVEADNGR